MSLPREMTAFAYREGALHGEDVALDRIAEAVGTPLYCYSTAAVVSRFRAFAAAFADLDATICYALKANSNLALVRTLAEAGAGADVVSRGELYQALAAGIRARDIVFSGVGKTRDELAAALEAGVGQINVESVLELEALNDVAVGKGVRAPVALRVNPDVDARTHAKITTGKTENKFGIDPAEARACFARSASLSGIDFRGLAVHIGSQVTDMAPFRTAFENVAALVREIRGDGYPVSRLDLGGGLGIAYGDEDPPDLDAYARVVRETTGALECALVFEPGRFIVGNAGVLVTRVLYVKKGLTRTFLVVDAAMNDLLRPTLYDGYHAIVPVKEPPPASKAAPVDVVGPVCETGDTFAVERPLPPVLPGDLLAICSVGAYGAVMASTYNLRLPAPEVLVKGEDFSVVRPRPSYDDLLARDRLPDWLAAPVDRRSRGAA